MKFDKDHDSITVSKLLDYHQRKKINLNPGFQRRSVWTERQQKDFIDSLLRNMPVPTMFFWKRKEGNKVVFDVIDGKQRTEAILAFTRRNKPLIVKVDPEDDPDWDYTIVDKWSWKDIQKSAYKKAKAFLNYSIPVVTVSGTLADIETLFVKINSTGSKLTKQEILSAKWNQSSKLLVACDKLAKSFNDYFIELGILSKGQISRMKAVELVAELLLSMEGGDVLHKKDALDSVMRHEHFSPATLARLSKELRSTFVYIKQYFPDIKTTRFKKIPDFYALVFSIWRMNKKGYVIKNRKKADLAFRLLKKLSVDIAKNREAYEQGGRFRLQSPAREYRATVISGSDSALHRKRRVEIIESLIEPILDTRAVRRTFSDHQKQLLWHSLTDRICPHCKEAIRGWEDVQVDHQKPYSRGGATSTVNGQLLHAFCNQSLGVKGL